MAVALCDVAWKVDPSEDLLNLKLYVEAASLRVNDEPSDGGERWDDNGLLMRVNHSDGNVAPLISSLESGRDEDSQIGEAFVLERQQGEIIAFRGARRNSKLEE